MKVLKKLLRSIVIFVLLIAAVFAFEVFSQSVLPTVEGAGYQIKLGSIHGSDLKEAGFDIPFGQKMSAKSWDDGIALEKDGKVYAYLTMFNIGSESREIERCKVGEILITDECDPVLTLNGEKLIGKDRASACKILGLKDTNGDTVSKSRGKYGISVYFSDDKVKNVKLKYDFGKVH
ncbi:MAG: hypothetical protein ACI4HI_14745 [Lachnospiraceae bacterium]